MGSMKTACRLTSEPSTRGSHGKGSGIGGKPRTKRRAEPLVAVSDSRQWGGATSGERCTSAGSGSSRDRTIAQDVREQGIARAQEAAKDFSNLPSKPTALVQAAA